MSIHLTVLAAAAGLATRKNQACQVPSILVQLSWWTGLPSVPLCVAESTQGDKVAHFITTEPAPRFQMMNLQIFHGAALLTPPAIPRQDLIL